MTLPEARRDTYLPAVLFLAGAFLYLLCLLPFWIYRGGIWFYYGDYNIQQVPFYIMCHRMVRQGYFFWNPLLDIGSNMGSSFAMYLWGSPFFWMTIPFPEAWIPNLIPCLMAMKYGLALSTAYMYASRRTKTRKGAYAAAILYAFSSFQGTNIVFAHFHDVTAFFPLYLLSFDELVQKGKRAGFAFMTGLMLLINYYFFFGQVIFLILYYLFLYSPDLGPAENLKRIGKIVACALPGICLAAVIWVQLLTGVFGNSRLDDFISGYDMLVYPDSTTPAAVLKSFFMPADPAGRGTLFTNDHIRVSSIAAYLPCMGIAGTAAYLKTRKKDRLSGFIICLAVMTMVPVLNASFSMFNRSVYARWYYMMLLMAALAAAAALEDENREALGFGASAACFGTILFCALSITPTRDESGWHLFGLIRFPELTAIQCGTALCMIPLLMMIVERADSFTKKRSIVRILTFACWLSTAAALFMGTSIVSNTGKDKWVLQMLGEKPLGEETGPFSRVETDDKSTNYDLVWGYPQMHSFQSTVNPSVFSFYRGLDLIRSVESTMPFEKIGGRAVISERYYLENRLVSGEHPFEEGAGIPDFELLWENESYAVYENRNFFPMGVTFRYYLTEEEHDVLSGIKKDRLFVKDLILNAQDAEKYGRLMEKDGIDPEEEAMTLEEFERYCDERRESACTEFAADPDGYTASADLPEENLVLFSIAYDKGFKAFVDGQETEILKADYGLMAVPVPAGRHEIRLYFRPYGYRAGCFLSLLGCVLILLLAVSDIKNRKSGTGNEFTEISLKCYDETISFQHEEQRREENDEGC